MKKLFFWLSIFVFIFAGGSCQRTKTYHIGVSQCSDDDWRQKMNGEILRELMFHPDAMVEIRSADDSNSKQIADIEYFIENDFDIIIAAPNEADAITPVIEEAYSKGIPVVLFDRGINGDSYTAWQGADNFSIGKEAASYLLNKAPKGTPVIEIYGLKGSTPADGRHKGFNSVDGINVIASGFGNWNYETAYAVADSLLEAHPEVGAVYAHNDRMAIAASDAARARGLSPIIIGIDAAPEIGIKAVADSVIDATFLYPTEGHRLIRTALAILKGEEYDTVVALPATPAVDASNVGVLLLQNKALGEETERMEFLKRQVDDYWTKHSSQTALFYAVIAIVVLLCGVLFLLLRTFWQHRRHREALEAATASKLAFFTNVSHDLRTPLTLIAEPVEQLASADNLTPRQHKLMKIADKNVRILRRLINQILDFRKFEHGKLDVNLAETDFAEAVGEWAAAFEGLARRHDISFNVNIDEKSDYRLAVDIEKMERVFYNLVANAFKYTPDNGTISIDCTCDGSVLTLKVADTGQGITEEDLPLIFDRFFQADRVHPNGSGIGLALAKAFVELHEGTISVESRHGEGTVFTVVLPVHHVGSETEKIATSIDSQVVNSELSVAETDKNRTFTPDMTTILVIDDNADIRVMLTEILSDSYAVLTAPDGTEGLRMAAKYVPDLIICDVMMPEMDGLECCRRLKSEVSTSHIPILMLTACAMDEQRIDGYEVGADGYVSKPFNTAVLVARTRNLIENRKRIREIWRSSGPAVATTEDRAPSAEIGKARFTPGSPDVDNEFYNRFLELVTEQMGNPELNVDSLASAMGLGRSQFYRKIKSLTNYSPVELLRRLRLARARDLLTSSERTISEISYAVGFSTPAYFTKCYREAFGETPSELRERLGIK